MSLIIKPGGAFTHKSGASFGVKSSAPAYIISGLEQSHWLASNAVLNGLGKAYAISDESGVTALTATPYSNQNYAFGYSANGWQLNGKVLPTISATESYGVYYRADAWASKLSGYTGAFTIATLIQPNWPSSGFFSQQLMRLWSTSSATSYQLGPAIEAYESNWLAHRRQGSSLQDVGFSGGTSKSRQLIVVEFNGSAGATGNPQQQWRMWINGTLRSSYVANGNNLVPSVTVDRFGLLTGGGAGSDPGAWLSGTQLAQFHIWKGALTDQQRTDVTAYLKSISGIA